MLKPIKQDIANFLELLIKQNSGGKTECVLCQNPGRSTKDDNSDWVELHENGCEILKAKELLKKLRSK
jgi:hypothetical protein